MCDPLYGGVTYIYFRIKNAIINYLIILATLKETMMNRRRVCHILLQTLMVESKTIIYTIFRCGDYAANGKYSDFNVLIS